MWFIFLRVENMEITCLKFKSVKRIYSSFTTYFLSLSAEAGVAEWEEGEGLWLIAGECEGL